MNAPDGQRLPREFFQRDPVTVAGELIGKTLSRRLADGTILRGRIVEVEAYLGIPDRAAHTFGGRRTPRNESMYLNGGHAYVYFTYGMHHCFNVVTDSADVPTACLIRALEPIAGIERMKDHRSQKIQRNRLKAYDWCSGPAKVCQAMAIDRDLDGVDMTTHGCLGIETAESKTEVKITIAKRIGITYAKEWADKPLRFLETDNRHVSVRP